MRASWRENCQLQDFGIRDSGMGVIGRRGACSIVRTVKAVGIFLLPILLSSLGWLVGWFFKLGDLKSDAVC